MPSDFQQDTEKRLPEGAIFKNRHCSASSPQYKYEAGLPRGLAAGGRPGTPAKPPNCKIQKQTPNLRLGASECRVLNTKCQMLSAESYRFTSSFSTTPSLI